MFEEFQRFLPRDPGVNVSEGLGAGIPDVLGLRELLGSFGGSSFAGGLYRVVHPNDLEVWNRRVVLGYPDYANRIICFGYDWLGGVYALDFQRSVEDQPGVLMFEPGSGESFQVPCNLVTFHDSGLRQFGEAALRVPLLKSWLGSGGTRPAITECVGYKVPLFLNGKDTVENLELSDLDVYWHITGQLISQVRGLPPGTPVRIRKPA